MTDKTDPIAHATRLLREAAQELQQGHTLRTTPNDWTGEPEAKAAYDEHMGAAAALECWAEAIGAGGVSPLMGKPQEMPDLTTLTERGAKAWAGVDAQGLREGVASAGSEPVARVNDDGFIVEIGDLLLAPGQKLYLHPSPTEGMVGGWIALPGTLPEPGTPVLLDIGKKYPIRAMWAAKFTLLVGLEDDSGFGEHDERTDEWYCPEGWYEWNEHEETHWRVTETPRAWAPLPPTTSAGSGKGA